MSVTHPIMTDEKADRREVFAAINAGLDSGLPAPSNVSLNDDHPIPSTYITLDSLADLCAWRDHFGMHKRPVNGQPHPSLTVAAEMEIWVSSTWMDWQGWHLSLRASDPITDEQRDEWMACRAAQFIEPKGEAS